MTVDIEKHSCHQLSTGSQQNPQRFKEKFPRLFSNDLGLVKDFVYRVKTETTVTPVQQKLRRLPLSARDKVSHELRKLEVTGVIEKIDASEWVSPIVVAWKKTGEIRLCVDLRKPNQAVVIDSHPLPHPEEIFHQLTGMTVFSKLDLSSAYHQMELAEESRDLIAFMTHDGLFRFKRVCFGLASAAAAFQKMLSTVLKGCRGTVHYLDDILVAGISQKEHGENLQQVLTRLQKSGMKLNSEKCTFSATKLQYLGHHLSREGIKPAEGTLKAISKAPYTTDVKSLQSFLGLASYYLKFLPHYATIVDLLRALLRKGIEFSWAAEQAQAFEKVKNLIKNCCTLAIFDPTLQTIVTTDASSYGLGAVLQQLHPEGIRMVAFATRTLSETERRYSVGEREALACLWACKRWSTVLLGGYFIFRTDHQALVTLLSTQGSGRYPCASPAGLQGYFNYEVQYRRGDQNVVTDALSRLPVTTIYEESSDHEDAEIICAVRAHLRSITLDELRR